MARQRLIDAIAAAPDDRGPWQVYADWLLERGEPRGELISLSLALEDRGPDPELADRVQRLERDEEALLSPRLYAQSHHWRLSFWRGFVRRADIMAHPDDPPQAEAIEALFADPHAALPLALSLVRAPDLAALCEALLAAPRAALHELVVVDLGAAASRLALGAPRLARLRLRLSATRTPSPAAEPAAERAVSALAHGELRELSASAQACPALRTGAAELPRLESLRCDIEPTDPLLAPGSLLFRPPPRLAHLALNSTGAPLTAETVERLAACPVLPQLRRLQLGFATPEALHAICERAAAFDHLASLTFSVIAPRAAGPPLRALGERALPRTRFELNGYAPDEAPAADA